MTFFAPLAESVTTWLSPADYLEAELLEVEQERNDILLEAVHGGEFVLDAFYLYAGDRRAGEARKDDAAKRVAERMAVAGIEAVYLIDAAALLFGDDARLARQCD